MDTSAIPGDIHASRAHLILGVSIALLVLSFVAVALRLLARRLSGAGLWWDDWLIIAALPWVAGLNISNIAGLAIGWGQHDAVLPPNTPIKTLREVYWFELIYIIAVGLIKFSILFFYRRIFPQRNVKILLWTVGAVVLCWQIALGFTFIFQCNPVHKAWAFYVPGTCLPILKLFLANAIPNIVTDFVIIAIPLPLILNLQISRSQKIALCGIFLTGGFVCAVSLVRLNYLIHTALVDITWNYVPLGLWSAVEPSIGLVSACLPSMRSLFRLLTSFISESIISSKTPSAGQVNRNSTSYPRNTSLHSFRFWQRRGTGEEVEVGSLKQLNGSGGVREVEVSSEGHNQRGGRGVESGVDIPLGEIHVTNEVEWRNEGRRGEW